jgi:hypothetical protein
MSLKDPREELSDFLAWAVGKTQAERSLRFNELVTSNDDFRRLAERLGFLRGSSWQDLPQRTMPDESYEDTSDD